MKNAKTVTVESNITRVTPEESRHRETWVKLRQAERVIEVMVAAGLVTQESVDAARKLAKATPIRTIVDVMQDQSTIKPEAK